MDFNRLVDETWIRHIYHKLEDISEEVEDMIQEVETVSEHSIASMFELDMDIELNDRNWLNYIYQKIEDLATDVENIIREVGIQALNHGNRVYSDIQELIQEVRANLSDYHDGYEHDDDVSTDDDEDDDDEVSIDDKDDGSDRDDKDDSDDDDDYSSDGDDGSNDDYSSDGDDGSNDDEDELIQEVHANLSGDHHSDEDDDDVNTIDDDDHEVSTDDVDDDDEDGDEVSIDNEDDEEDDSSDGDDEDDSDDADESSNYYEDDGNEESNNDEDDDRDGDDDNSKDTAGLSEGNLNVRNGFSTQQLSLALSEGEDLVGEREYPYGNIVLELEQDSTAIVEENDIAPQMFDDFTPRDIEQLDGSTTDETFHSCDSDPWDIVFDISYQSGNLTDDEFEKTWELIDDKEVHSIPHQLQGGSTKERILNPFGKKKMLAKEYEELATLFKDADKEDDQAALETSLPATHPN